jgi:hypothetical protein
MGDPNSPCPDLDALISLDSIFMTTWTTVNLPWANSVPSPRIPKQPHPEDFEKIQDQAQKELIWEEWKKGSVFQIWLQEINRIEKDFRSQFFSSQLEVGMLIEFADGTRLLVGDVSKDGCWGGEHEAAQPEDIVVRFCMVSLPE